MAKINIMLSADELNKFLGEDSEAAAEFKSAIVQDFAKRYLKVFSEDEMEKAKNEIKRLITEESSKGFYNMEKTPNGYGQRKVLTPEIKRMIQDQVNLNQNSIIKDVIQETSEKLLERIEENLYNKLYVDIISKVEDKFTSKLIEDITAAIKTHAKEKNG